LGKGGQLGLFFFVRAKKGRGGKGNLVQMNHPWPAGSAKNSFTRKKKWVQKTRPLELLAQKKTGTEVRPGMAGLRTEGEKNRGYHCAEKGGEVPTGSVSEEEAVTMQGGIGDRARCLRGSRSSPCNIKVLKTGKSCWDGASHGGGRRTGKHPPEQGAAGGCKRGKLRPRQKGEARGVEKFLKAWAPRQGRRGRVTPPAVRTQKKKREKVSPVYKDET